MPFLHAAFLSVLLLADVQIESRAGGAPSPVVAAMTVQAEDVLAQLGIEGEVTGRIKSAESLNAKAARKGLRPDQVLDRVGFRVLVGSVADCYDIRDALAARYPVVDGSADDYIAQPKPNGYQSLHFAAMTPFGVAEFQVRTHEMHTFAESGPAAHARYKEYRA